MARPKLYDTLYERVLSKVVVLDWQNENGCWLYCGPLDKDGYGYVSYRVPGGGGKTHPKNKRVHIVTWEAVNGPLPEGMTLDHIDCVAKACCNHDHLECVTRVENSKRRWRPRYAAV